MAVVVTVASVEDCDGARLPLSRLGGACKKLRLIWVDGGDRGQLLDWAAKHRSCRPQVVPRAVVERTFAWPHHHLRLSKDHERLISNSEALVQIVMIRLMLRRLARA